MLGPAKHAASETIAEPLADEQLRVFSKHPCGLSILPPPSLRDLVPVSKVQGAGRPFTSAGDASGEALILLPSEIQDQWHSQAEQGLKAFPGSMERALREAQRTLLDAQLGQTREDVGIDKAVTSIISQMACLTAQTTSQVHAAPLFLLSKPDALPCRAVPSDPWAVPA
jgi:hypothetical protein